MSIFSGIIVKKPRKKIAQRQLELRKKLWPDVGPEWLWDRHVNDGFTTLPGACRSSSASWTIWPRVSPFL